MTQKERGQATLPVIVPSPSVTLRLAFDISGKPSLPTLEGKPIAFYRRSDNQEMAAAYAAEG
jgi:hypothetical protein